MPLLFWLKLIKYIDFITKPLCRYRQNLFFIVKKRTKKAIAVSLSPTDLSRFEPLHYQTLILKR